VRISVTRYGDWTWETPRGITGSELENDIRNRDYYIEGFGKIRMADSDNSPLDFLRGGAFGPPWEHSVNRGDLKRRLTGARVVLMVEDDDSDSLTSGMMEEVNILRSAPVRKINIRLVNSIRCGKNESIFGFTSADEETQDPSLRWAYEAYRNRLTLWVLKQHDGTIEEASLEVVKLAVAVACYDKAAEWGARSKRPELSKNYYPVVIDPPHVVRLYSASDSLIQYIESTFPRLITHDEFFIRRGAMLPVLGAYDIHMIARAASQAAAAIISLTGDEKNLEKLKDFAWFMWNTRWLKWEDVIQAINDKTGINIVLEDDSG
jgi:hypothetical protein